MRFVTEPGAFRFSVGGAADRARTNVVVDVGGDAAAYRQREIVATVFRSS
jgi:hypothetical protein